MFKQLYEDAIISSQSTPGSNGIDLYSYESNIIKAGEYCCFSTGISIKFNQGTYGLIASRSGLAFNKQIIAFNGVIDYDYIGEIKVLLFNLSKYDYNVKKGDKIAQLLILPSIVKVVEKSEHKGFGSTGN